MEALGRRPGVSFAPIDEVVAKVRAEIVASPRERAARLLAHLERYYLCTAGERGRATTRGLRALVGAKRP
jgi:hypothetical protein